MKKIILALSFLFLTVSCKEAIQTEQVGTYEVDLLFEKDGCKVYRFFDKGDYAYFSDCSGSIQYIKEDSYMDADGNLTTDKTNKQVINKGK